MYLAWLEKHFPWLFSWTKPAQLAAIYSCSKGGEEMQSCQTAVAILGRGLEGDRYANGVGYWHLVESCQVTLISEHDLCYARNRANTKVSALLSTGQHRRNLVITGLNTKRLKGHEFTLGEAVLRYEKPRPPCGYIDGVAARGMAKALGRRSGVCITVVKGGVITVGDTLKIIGKARP